MSDLIVTRQGARLQGRHMVCAIGRGGIGEKQTEGDGISPIGRFAITDIWCRRDRVALPMRAITPAWGWSDDARDPQYNRAIRWPGAFRHERLHRADAMYDLFAVLDYNSNPVIPGAGSAIFLHIWRVPRRATAGCIAFSRHDLSWILGRWRPNMRVVIQS